MKTRQSGTTDLKITQIMIGNWQVGRKMWVGIDDTESTQAAWAAFEATLPQLRGGFNRYDQADGYRSPRQ